VRTPAERGSRLWLLRLALALSAGCGASTPAGKHAAPQADTRAAPAAIDWSLRLAQQLPRGADQCTVLRPVQLPAERRALYGALSQASELATLDGLQLEGYAEARREGRSGPGRRLILLRSAAPPAALRELLERQAPLALRWVDADAPAETCHAVDCPALVRQQPDGVLRIELGPWPQDLAPGAEALCVEQAGRAPGALEVAARRGALLHDTAPLALPLRSLSVVHAASDGVLLERLDRLPSPELAQLLAEPSLELDWLPEAETRLGTELSRVQEGSELRTRVQVLWDDLALAAADRQRYARAERYADALGQLRPEAAVPLDDADAVLREVELLRTLRESSGATPPSEWLRRSRTLLERAVAQHPGEPRLARALAELPR
jgi:hypothetical protein